MPRQTRQQSPISRLYFVLVYAARDIKSPGARANAAARAALIPRTYDERYNTQHAECVRRARIFLRRLPEYSDEMLADAAREALGFAEVVHAAMYRPRLPDRKTEVAEAGEAA